MAAAPPGHKVAALVSGGKDSCYNMMLCQEYGHEIVVLGNLLPVEEDVDELDSYMYQTVGHHAVAAYAACMGLPLVRRRIRGTSAEQRLAYQETEGDEVEDLLVLLADIKERYPDVTAVSSGAIASDYQRTRVEHVCSRLGLVSLAYMWREPQPRLFRGMVAAGVHAVLVKVAALGLEPRKHLGKSLAQMQPHLWRLAEQFGCNPCGEGGEYETLVLDCPLFKRARIAVDASDVLPHSDDPSVAVLRLREFHVELKGGEGGSEPVPAGEVVEVDREPRLPPLPPPPREGAAPRGSVSLGRGGGHLHASWSCAPGAFPAGGPGEERAAASRDAMAAAMRGLGAALEAAGSGLSDAVLVHLYVGDMADFAAVNSVYCRLMPMVEPPSRACVELPLPEGCPLRLDVLARGPRARAEEAAAGQAWWARESASRRVLHVQSISRWAPSCIGPYSQATEHRGVVHMAGVIGLDPPTMALVGGGARAQCLRALHSAESVAVAMGTTLRRRMVALTVYVSAGAGPGAPAECAAALADWLAGTGGPVPPLHPAGSGDGGGDGDGDDDEHAEEDAGAQAPPGREGSAPPQAWETAVCYVVVPSLPKGALVEVQPLPCAVPPQVEEEEDSSDDEEGGGGGERSGAAAPRRFWQLGLESSSGERAAGPGGVLRVRRQAVRSHGHALWVRVEVAGGTSSATAAASSSSSSLVAAVLHEELAAAGLGLGGVSSLRVYHPVGGGAGAAAGAVDAGELGADLARELAAGEGGGGEEGVVAPVLVPCCGCGITPGVEGGVLVELAALPGGGGGGLQTLNSR